MIPERYNGIAMHRLPICVITLLTAVLPAVRAQSPTEVEEQIRSTDARRIAALTRGDVQALDRLLSPDLVYTHASGWRQSKAEFMAAIRSGELIYHTFVMRDVTMRVYGDTVVAAGSMAAKVHNKGQELDVDLLFLEVYVKQQNRWQLAAWQSTRRAP